MIGTRDPPTSVKSHHHGSGFHGSPVEPSTTSDERSWARGRLAAVRHQGANRGGADPQVRDPVALDQRPQPIRPGIVGRALEDEEGGAQHRRPGHRPGTHHPAHVGEPEERVAALQVEAVGQVHGGLQREAGVDVDGALRPPGGAGGVDDHERVVGIGRGRLQRLIRGRCHRCIPPDVARRAPRHIGSRATDDQAALDRWRRGERLVGGRLHRHRLAATGRSRRR